MAANRYLCARRHHATHQTLKELYLGKQPVSLSEYVRIKGDAEVGSFVAELKVHSELDSPGKVTYSAWKDAHSVDQPDKDLGELHGAGGKAALSKFILLDSYVNMDINGSFQISNYSNYYASTYSQYLFGFSQARNSLDELLKRNPSVEKKIVQGQY